MAKQVRKFTFTDSAHQRQKDLGNSEHAYNPYRMFEVLLPSGAKPVMANIDRKGEFCLWIEGDFASNRAYWNQRFYAAYFTGKDIPGNADHAGSTVDDRDGTVYHCYDISDWMNHVPKES